MSARLRWLCTRRWTPRTQIHECHNSVIWVCFPQQLSNLSRLRDELIIHIVARSSEAAHADELIPASLLHCT